ncbi:glycosyltransferase family 1 protein [Loktanella sp. S4079]|uniref:glycosyltransferase family 1 protein n=1 Tax=Loktanella sp. S4079 TaxID=579483 RepID=UPI0005FA7AF5|nr:glycosyltransferase family 1 protein [Loktanella sp. S4079]KJZ18628.1 hypothetical protein TW80_14610 [Loktanella sp. S4079]
MFDVVCAIDPRFAGGTAAALASDVTAFLDAGRSVGLIEVTSPYLADMRAPRSKVIEALHQDPRLRIVNAATDGVIRAKTAFLHHPMTFFYGLDQKIRLEVESAFLVAHHLPFRGDGSLQYDPVATSWRSYRATGAWPVWAPVSGVCRQQLQSFAPFIRIAGEDWPNVFDISEWTPQRQKFGDDVLTIGRHGRADPLKWPETAAKVAAGLPVLPQSRIRVMGVPEQDLRDMGVDMSGWQITPFDTMPVPVFVDELDIFAYHYHPMWAECFGRTIAEAMLMGVPCVLDPRLKPTFGDLAIYCPVEQAGEMIEKLRADPVGARKMAATAHEAMIARHGTGSVDGRLDRFASGSMTRASVRRVASPLAVLRKTMGMIRRKEYFLSHLSAKQ